MPRLAILFLLLFSAVYAHAQCRCNAEKYSGRAADVEFVGKVLKVEGMHNGWSYPGALFEIIQKSKFPETVKKFTQTEKFIHELPRKTIESEFSESFVVVDSESHDNQCAVKFEVGKIYRVKAERVPLNSAGSSSTKEGYIAERWWTNQCWETELIP